MDNTFKSYLIEGIFIGTVVATINVYSGEISFYLTGKEDDKKILWTIGLIVTITSHIMAEMLRGPRILKILQDYVSFIRPKDKTNTGMMSTLRKGVSTMTMPTPSLASSVNNAIILNKLRKLNS